MSKLNFRDYHIEKLKDINEATIYLEIALQEYEGDDDAKAFLLALKDVAEAQGGITQLSQKTKMSRPSLYKTLSSKGNPKINTFSRILRELGFKIRLEPIKDLGC